MDEVCMVKCPAQAAEMFKPLRLEILKRLAEPHSCPELGKMLGLTPQKVYYHVKALQKAGLVRKIGERKARGIMEGIYQAGAKSYWLSPDLVRLSGGKRAAQEKLARSYVAGLAEQMQLDLGSLSNRQHENHTLGLEAQVQLRDDTDRAAFRKDVERAIKRIAAKYGARDDDHRTATETYKIMLAVYPSRQNDKPND